MSASTALANAELQKVYNAVELAWDADVQCKLHLHTASPGVGGTTATNEATYTGYAAVAVARTVGGFTVTANAAVNAALAQFPECTAGTDTITHVSIGTNGTVLLHFGALSASRSVSAGIQPQFAASALTVTVT